MSKHQTEAIRLLAESCIERWQEHGRLYSTAIYEYKRWMQMSYEQQERTADDILFRLKSLTEWFDKVENHNPN